MKSVIIRSNVSMYAPDPDTPFVPDIDSDLLWTLKAADLSLADGATVDSWLASGVDTVANRTFSTTASGWAKPTFDADGGPDGGPAVAFDGTQQIANGAGTSAVNQPNTFAFVCRTDNFASEQARLVTTSGQFVRPSANGYSAGVVTASRLDSLQAPAGWTTVIAVFNGDNSMIKVGLNPAVRGPTGASGTGRSYIGGQSSTFATQGLVGAIAEVRHYARGLTEVDMDALAIALHRAYGML